MKATIEVEFEAVEGQPENVLEAALVRGLSHMRSTIEAGKVGLATGIKRGTVRTTVTEKSITR